MAFVLQRLLVVAALAAAGLLVGLAHEDWILESEARPGAGTDSNVVTARGFPDAWLVTEDRERLADGPPLRRVVPRPLALSALCWMAGLVLPVAGVAALRRRAVVDPAPLRELGRAGEVALATLIGAATAAGLELGIAPGSGTGLALAAALGVFLPLRLLRFARGPRIWVLTPISLLAGSFVAGNVLFGTPAHPAEAIGLSLFAAACFLIAIALGVAGRYVCRVPSLWPGGPGSVRRLLGAKG
jgi:hypothetical protein